LKIERAPDPAIPAIEGELSGAGRRFAVVVARFNSFITERLLLSAIDGLLRSGAKNKDIDLVRVPGAFEIPLAARELASTKKYDAIICLGCLLRGDTAHYDVIVNEEAFLRLAVHNLAIDQYRHDGSGSHREVPIEEVDRRSPLMAPGPTPDQILESQQRLDCLTALLDSLNPRTREIYFAHRSGYTYAEIADDMGLAEITIRRHIARAQAALPRVND